MCPGWQVAAHCYNVCSGFAHEILHIIKTTVFSWKTLGRRLEDARSSEKNPEALVSQREIYNTDKTKLSLIGRLGVGIFLNCGLAIWTYMNRCILHSIPHDIHLHTLLHTPMLEP